MYVVRHLGPGLMGSRAWDAHRCSTTPTTSFGVCACRCNPVARAYEASFELLLEHLGSDLSVVIPVGATRGAVTLDLYHTSGLGLVAGQDWNRNTTSVIRILPIQRFLPVIITVRPSGSDAAITVQLGWLATLLLEGASGRPHACLLLRHSAPHPRCGSNTAARDSPRRHPG
jgi:hypothetical protein